MAPVLTEHHEKVLCDCPHVHRGSIDVRTRRRHHRLAGMVDCPDEPPILVPQGRNQLNIIPNDGLPLGYGLKEPQINSPTSPEEAEDDNADNMQNSYDWPMDFDEGDDGRFSGVKRTQNPPDEKVGSDHGAEEDIEDPLRLLTINFSKESTFEYDSDGGDSLLSDDDLFEDMDDDIPDSIIEDEEESLRLLLQHLKELSGTSHWCFEAKIWQ